MNRPQSYKKISPLTAGIAFTVVGAAAATTYALSNEKTRKQISDTFYGMKDTLVGKFKDHNLSMEKSNGHSTNHMRSAKKSKSK